MSRKPRHKVTYVIVTRTYGAKVVETEMTLEHLNALRSAYPNSGWAKFPFRIVK